MDRFLKFFALTVTAALSFYAFMDQASWTLVLERQKAIQKNKVWQVHFMHEDKPMIYTVQSQNPTVRVFHGSGPFHHALSLQSYGVKVVSGVALAEPLQGAGQVLYMGDRGQGRIFYLVLGKKHIREMPLHPELPSAYGDFLAALHPVAESERHY